LYYVYRFNEPLARKFFNVLSCIFPEELTGSLILFVRNGRIILSVLNAKNKIVNGIASFDYRFSKPEPEN